MSTLSLYRHTKHKYDSDYWIFCKGEEKEAAIFHTPAFPEFSKYHSHSYTEWTRRFMYLIELNFHIWRKQSSEKSDIQVKALIILLKNEMESHLRHRYVFSKLRCVQCQQTNHSSHFSTSAYEIHFFQVKENCFQNMTKTIFSCLHLFCTDH